MIYCILWKRNGLYEMFTNQIFTHEKEAEDFAKRSGLKKKHDCKITEFKHKYFQGVEKIEE